MTFLSSLFTCCEPNSKATEAEAETRRARIVAVYDQSYNRSFCALGHGDMPMPPPKYSEIAADCAVVVSSDEKSQITGHAAEGVNIPPQQRRNPVPASSDTSSVISIPSTRLSGLTSTYTGRTVRARRQFEASGEDDDRSSWRDSGIYSDYSSSAPPSYYAGSSTASEGRRTPNINETHPVMANGWLERLRCEAERQHHHQND